MGSDNDVTAHWTLFRYARVLVAAALAIAVAASGKPAAAAGWKPEKNVEFVAMSGPGGANDIIARTVQGIIQQKKLVDAPITVVSKVGGGGVLAWAYLNQHAGDGAYLSISPINLLIEHIIGASPITYTDLTPIAQLFNEYVAFAVKPESPLKTGKDLIERLKSDPGAVSFAIAASLGGANHLATLVAMKAANVDTRKLKFVVFSAGTQGQAAVMGGHVDVAVAPVSGVVAQVGAGRLRVITVSSPQRLGGAFAAVPTWREQGVNSVFSSWRGVIGPKGLTRAQIVYWEDVIAKVVQTEEWKKEMTSNYWESNFMTSADSRRYLKSQYDEYKAVLVDVGLAK
jgi:putative tricarboxylic transport membrane protein